MASSRGGSGTRARRRAADRAAWRERQLKRDPSYMTRATNKSHQHNRPFLGIDGEAINDLFCMITAANDQIEEVLESPNGEELRTGEILDWLISLPDGAIKVGFWFDYDVNMMLVDLEERHLRQLASLGRCYWGDYIIRHIPGKRFSIYNRRAKKGATIWDMSSFIKTSFVRMLRAWEIGDQETWDRIDEMKQIRGEFTEQLRDEIRAYNLEECVLLARASKRMREAAVGAGIRPRDYYGGGSLASVLLRRFEIERYRRDWENPVHEEVYFGGRFENALVGKWPDRVWVYDINSAYPTALQDLPCLAHGHWEEGRPRAGEIALQHVTWDLGEEATWGPFPHRPKVGSLVYPPNGKGKFWSPEVAAAKRQFGSAIKIGRSVRWVQVCNHDPFHWVKEQADYRLRLKKEKDFGAQMLKLGLNSIYGKLAQRVGKPRYRTPVWAGLVTSRVRAMLLDALGPDPSLVIAMSTDSVISTQPLFHLPLGSKLGEWTLEVWEWVFIAQGGIYFWPGEGGVIQKSRGFTGRGMTYQMVKAAWEQDGIFGVVPVPQHRFIGYRTGLIRKDPVWRTWVDEERKMSFMPLPRRIPRMPDPSLSYSYTDPIPWEAAQLLEADDLAWYDEDPTWWDSAKLADMEHLEQPEPSYE